jgi:hypothetical protein
MTLKEKLTQVILDLNRQSIKYPRMKTTDVTYMLSRLIEIECDEDKKLK